MFFFQFKYGNFDIENLLENKIETTSLISQNNLKISTIPYQNKNKISSTFIETTTNFKEIKTSEIPKETMYNNELANKISNEITTNEILEEISSKTTNNEYEEKKYTNIITTQESRKSDFYKYETTTPLKLNVIENILNEIKLENFNNSNYTSEEINKLIYEKIIENVIKNIEDLNENKEGIIIEGKDSFFYHITSLENDLANIGGKNNVTNQFSKIDLGVCEDILRDTYNIDKNVSLAILKFEKLTTISSERNLQYEVYKPTTMTRLNLSVCKNIPIDIHVPVTLTTETQQLYEDLKDLGYDLFDINNIFYQDICTPYESTNGTDVLLSDRVDFYYNNNNEAKCQPNCKFLDYSVENNDLKCECNIESSEIDMEKNEEDIGAKSIITSFYDVLKFSNYKVLKCHKLSFNSSIFKGNIGNYLVFAYFTIYVSFLIIYFIKGSSYLKDNFLKDIIDVNLKELVHTQKIIFPDLIKEKAINIEKEIKNENKILSFNHSYKTKKENNNNNVYIVQTKRKNTKRKRKTKKSKIEFKFPPKKNSQNGDNVLHNKKNPLIITFNSSTNIIKKQKDETNKIDKIGRAHV